MKSDGWLDELYLKECYQYFFFFYGETEVGGEEGTELF
jgi:hypothetical protein